MVLSFSGDSQDTLRRWMDFQAWHTKFQSVLSIPWKGQHHTLHTASMRASQNVVVIKNLCICLQVSAGTLLSFMAAMGDCMRAPPGARDFIAVFWPTLYCTSVFVAHIISNWCQRQNLINDYGFSILFLVHFDLPNVMFSCCWFSRRIRMF